MVMAIKSLRKKPNKRSSGSNPTTPRSDLMNPSAASSRSNPRVFPFLISAFFFAFLILFFRASTNTRIAVGLDLNADHIYTVEVLHEFPHDPDAFTQGLLYAGNDTLFESTGINGQSSVRRVAIENGKVLEIHRMKHTYFGEGLTLFGDRLFQVTWLKNSGFIYDRNNLSKVKPFKHQMQDGWGLATDGKVLFGSDGTSTLYKIDPQTLKTVDKHIVKYRGNEVNNLNELEYVNDEVWANVWLTDCIARISSKDGDVMGWIYLPELRGRLFAAGYRGIDVLNGIAWDQERDRIFVTGKLWPKLYEIKVEQRNNPFDGDIRSLCMPPPHNFGKT